MKQQQQQQRPQSQQSGSQIYGVHSLNFHTRNPSWDKSIGINASSSSSTAIAATATATATAAAPKFRMNTTKTLLPMVLPPISGSSSPILVSSSSSNSSSSPLALRYSHGHLCYGSGGGGCGGGGGGPMFMSPQITAQREHSRAVQQLQQFQLQQVQPRSPLYVYNSSDSSGSSSGLRQHCEHYAEEEEEVEGEEEQYNHHRYHNHHHYRKRTDTADSNSNTTTQNYHNHHILFEDNEGEERRHHHHKTQDSVSSNSNSNSNSSSSSGKRRHRNSPLLDTNESEEQQDHNRPRHHRPHHHRRHHHKSGSRESGEYSHHSNESEEQQEHNHHKSSSRESGEHNDNDNYNHRSHSRKHKHKHSGSYSESSKDTYCTTTTSSPSNQGLKSSPFTSRSPILSITASTSDTPQDASNASPLTGVEYAVEPHRIAGCNFCQTNRRYFYSLSNKVVLHSTSHQQRCRRNNNNNNNNNSNSNHYHQQQQQQQQQPAIYGYQYKLQPQQLLPQMSPRSSLQVQTNYPVHGYAKQAPGLGYAQLSGEGRSSSNSSNSSSSTTANITGPNTARAYTSSMSMSVEASSMSTSISGDEDTAAATTTTGTAAATATVETDVPLPSSGDILGDDSEPERYRVKSVLGKGAFGFVLQAYDQVAREDVAIKLVRNVPAYASMAMNEAKILELLSTADPSGDYNTLRAKRNHAGGTACWFLYRGAYVCIVTELLSTSLYSLIERTAFYGVSLRLVRNFGRQILVALSFLASPAVSVVHCDLKPENVLMCDPKKPNVRVIDFGSSVAPGGVLHKYAQSRFYRAPEVILRLPYSFPADMWSLACILFELHVGTPLFQGNNEAEQVAEFVSVLGLPPQRMILSSTVAPEYFVPRSSGGFTLAPRLLEKYDPRRLADMIGVDAGGPDGKRILEPGHSRSDYLCFLDLLERMLAYDPAERITPQQALGHAFFATV